MEEIGGSPTLSALTASFAGLAASFDVSCALSGCVFSPVEAVWGAGMAGRAVEGCFPAGEGVLSNVCCDLNAGLMLILCARAVIGDKWLEGFAEDIKASVRRGIRLGLLFVRRLL